MYIRNAAVSMLHFRIASTEQSMKPDHLNYVSLGGLVVLALLFTAAFVGVR